MFLIKKLLLIIFFILFCFLFCLIYLFYFYSPGINVNPKEYPITGMDVSSGVGEINFESARENGFQFVILRSTIGFEKDSRFENYYLKASKASFPIGVYHNLVFDKDGIKQAGLFLKTIEKKRLKLPLIVDVEDWGNWPWISKQVAQKNLYAFITEVEGQTGQKVMIYTNKSGYNTYVKGQFDMQPLWISSFSDPPIQNKKWVFWQHFQNKKFDFAQGGIDLNVFNGNSRDWERFIWQKGFPK